MACDLRRTPEGRLPDARARRSLARHGPAAGAVPVGARPRHPGDRRPHFGAGSPGPLWAALFPGQLPASPLDFEIDPDPFTIDGSPVVPIEVGHSDTGDISVLHVPELGLVVAGDVVCNNVHLYLADAADGGAAAWRDALDRVAALHPRHVVAGHKDATRPDDPADIDETRRYLDEAMRILESSGTRFEFFTRMVERFPGRVNPTTTWLSSLRLRPTQDVAAS
ncbi:MBL fold metallo-hydrolase [Actinoplanes sp. NPDC051343]|uniref:MBL fold metallo-hydrolase n=1 Tax=Actinoplanes sp. NPDC051343 TaxID=3363906 RepID=UPI00378AB14C